MPGWRKSETIGRVALVGTAILGLGRVAAAEPESVRIDYMAPASCPDATAFLRSRNSLPSSITVRSAAKEVS